MDPWRQAVDDRDRRRVRPRPDGPRYEAGSRPRHRARPLVHVASVRQPARSVRIESTCEIPENE
jgi:hypothetical protein